MSSSAASRALSSPPAHGRAASFARVSIWCVGVRAAVGLCQDVAHLFPSLPSRYRNLALALAIAALVLVATVDAKARDKKVAYLLTDLLSCGIRAPAP